MMDPKDIKTLRILEAFEQDPSQSQRALSGKLEISLGLVNLFIKRLAKKGYFKISTIPKKRAQYILTPKGMAEKTRLTYQYILYSLQYYKDTRSKIRQIFDDLELQGVENVFFYGVSELAEIAYITIKETNLVLAGVIDDEQSGEMFMSLPVEHVTRLKNNSSKDFIVITKIENGYNIFKALVDNGVTMDRIVDLRV